MEELARHLTARMAEAQILITTTTVPADPVQGAITFLKPPAEKRSEVQVFLNRWAPDLCVWVRGDLRPVLLTEVEATEIPRFLIDAAEASLQAPRAPWRLLSQRSSLRGFTRLLAQDDAAAQRLAALGARPWRIEVTGPLREGAIVLPFAAAERDYLSESLLARPTWFGAAIPDSEFGMILQAHTAVLARAHRTLAVVTPVQLSKAAQLAYLAEEAGLRVTRRRESDEIDPECQLLIADLPDEYGLWYRLAPLSYMGGTLTQGSTRDPFEAAALGSAVIHGGKSGRFSAKYARLQAAGASRRVSDAPELGRSLTELSSPDRSSLLAHAAWDATSSGASVIDRVLAMIETALDPERVD